jgi:class 3 adenylate cyclase
MANMRTTVILKTDIVDSTPRTAAQTQAEMGLQRKQHKRLISETAAKNQGSIFQEEGDSYWIEFPSVTSATHAAIQMHQNLRSTQAGKQEKHRLAIRAVITVGDILYQENDSIGTTLSLTAQIEKVTPADEIYLSHAAWLVLNKAEVQTSFVNEFNFKGFREPENVYKVDQKHKTRVLTDQFIMFTDVKRFTPFIRSASIEEVESLLLDCDDLINEVCDKHGGIIRQVNGDQYFLTFTAPNQAMMAVEQLCHSWEKIAEQYHLGISIGIHKGNLNVLRSFVYGDDIHTTTYLTQLEKIYFPNKMEVHAITSRRVREALKGTKWKERFRELTPTNAAEELFQRVVREHGAFEFLLDDQMDG